MKLEINITKGKFWVLVCLGIFLVGIMVYAVANDKPNPGHSASGIGPGEFFGTADDKWTFPGKVEIEKDLEVKGNIIGIDYTDCKWSSCRDSPGFKACDSGYVMVGISLPELGAKSREGACSSECTGEGCKDDYRLWCCKLH